MEMRYMTYKNEEGQKERFYPITHKDAIVGLSDVPEVSRNDLISTEAASEIVGDAPEIDPAIVDLVNSLTAEDVGALPIQMITCAYGNTDEEIIRGLSENWSELSNGIGSIQFSNGADIWYGTYYKYTDTIGSILMQNASGAYSKKFIRNNNTLIDLYTENNKPTAYDLSIPVNNNILINSNFANPVNQRGYVSGTDCTQVTYVMDRWYISCNKTSKGSVTFNDNSITVNLNNSYQGFVQKVEFPENYIGKTLTISANVKSLTGNLYFILGNDTTKKIVTGLNEYTATIPKGTTEIQIGFFGRSAVSFEIEWIKLEIGDHATPYVPRLYAEELALCKRYFRILNTYVQPHAYDVNSLAIWTKIPFPQMRVTPTAVISFKDVAPTIMVNSNSATSQQSSVVSGINKFGIEVQTNLSQDASALLTDSFLTRMFLQVALELDAEL